MGHYVASPEDNKGPTPNGLWLEHAPDEAEFWGTINGKAGHFWKDKRGVVEMKPNGRFWNYSEYFGVWVENYLTAPSIPVSMGEILDRLSILEIKRRHITDTDKRRHLFADVESLLIVVGDRLISQDYLDLVTTNQMIWDAIETVNTSAGETASRAAIVAHEANLQRFKLKSEINAKFNSSLREQKSHL